MLIKADLEEYEDEVTELVSEDGDSEGMDEQDGEDDDAEEESGDEEVKRVHRFTGIMTRRNVVLMGWDVLILVGR